MSFTVGFILNISMSNSFPIFIMMAPHGPSPAEAWVSSGIQAAGLDLIQRLGELRFEHKIFVLAAEPKDQAIVQHHGAIPLKSPRSPFHFGQSLIEFFDLAIFSRG